MPRPSQPPTVAVPAKITKPPPEELEEGSLVGQLVAERYRVLKKLGEGGMGIVYLAEHITIEKRVALKVLLHEYARKADLKERFLQEAKAAARIGHENIVDITDFGDSPDGSVFFAMEFLDGEDLSRMIKGQGPVAWSRAKPILLQICRALGAAHSKGIIHRDMKPENIYLVEREGRTEFVKVLDFGIAKMSMDDRESRLTRTGMIFGTPEYMSPEQAQGNKPDHRVDVYAVGVIMYEMLTGQVPFKADTFMGILTKHIFEQPLPPSQINPSVAIPAEVERLVLKALSKERDERFQSMAEMAAAITQASGRVTRPTGDAVAASPRIMSGTSSGPIPTVGETMLANRGAPGTTAAELDVVAPNRAPLIVALAAILLLGGGAGVFFYLRGRDPAPRLADTKQHVPPPEKKDPGQPPPPRVAAAAADAAAPLRGGQTVTVKLTTRPTAIDIYQGDKKIGTSGEPLVLPRGKEPLVLTLRHEGYEDRQIPLTPEDNQSVTVDLVKLTPRPPFRGKKGLEPKKAEPKKAEPKKVELKPEPKPEPKKVEPKKKKKKSGDGELKNPFDDD